LDIGADSTSKFSDPHEQECCVLEMDCILDYAEIVTLLLNQGAVPVNALIYAVRVEPNDAKYMDDNLTKEDSR
jgi:hypothetical protein